MAAGFSVTIKCRICDRSNTITNANEATKGNITEEGYQCPECGHMHRFWFSSIAVTHSASIGSNTTVTATMATIGSVSTAVS